MRAFRTLALGTVLLAWPGLAVKAAPPEDPAGASAAPAQAAIDEDEEPAPPAPPVAEPEPAAAPPARRPAPPRRFRRLRTEDLTHRLQFGLAVMPGVGYRGIFPYQEDPARPIDCGQPDKRVCVSRLPFFIDLQGSFGLTTHWDILLDVRLGIERDFTQTRQFAVAPGFRYWVDPELPFKFFATVQVAFDTTAQHNPDITNNDIAFRNSNGFMFEVMRNLGFYFQFGETIGFRRWLRFEVDVGVGIQARFP